MVAQKSRKAEWLLEGIMPARGITLLAGQTSSGKSLLALELAIGVAQRGIAWGMKCGVKGKVGFWCSDANEGEAGRRVSELCKGYACAVPKDLRFDFDRRVFNDEQAEGLLKTIRREGYQLLIVDPLSRYLPWMNDNSTRGTSIGLQTMRELCNRTGVSIVLVQGFNKQQKKGPDKWGRPVSDGTEQVRGSIEVVSACDATFLVRKQSLNNEINLAKNRLGQADWIRDFNIVDEISHDGEKSLCLVFGRIMINELQAPSTLAELVKMRIKQVMRKTPRTNFCRAELMEKTKKQVCTAGKRAFAEAFALLRKDSDVVVESGDKNFKYYRLREPIRAFYDSLVEEYGEGAALDLYSKKLMADVRLLQADRIMENSKAKNEDKMLMDEILERLNHSHIDEAYEEGPVRIDRESYENS
ncbi:MAG: AAA family ATPase [Anaerolineaceae bacterium]|nr:AAA family ATPase [Anaerolineaceae bacterium]